MKKLIAMLAGATALVAVSSSAQAAPVVVYSPVVGGSFSGGFFSILTGTSFNQQLSSFTIGAANAGKTFTANLTDSGSIEFTMASLFKALPGPDTLVASFSGGNLGPTVLSSGTYYLAFAGTNSGLSAYAGTLNYSAAPEPAAWSLMILGFGAVGFAMRRQRATYRVAYN